MERTIRAVLFDMDGVIVDSEGFIRDAAIAMFRELGLAVAPRDFVPFVGTGENRYLGGVAERYGLAIDVEAAKKRTYELFGDLIKGSLKALPGSVEFIELCRSRSLRIALATSADPVKARANLAEIGLSFATFDAVVSGLDVARTKPDPDIYLAAAKRLGVAPERCLVVEDALTGLAAARAAGSRCLMLTTSFPRETIEPLRPDWIASDLSKAPPEALEW